MNKIIMSTGLCWLWLAFVVLILDLSSKQWIIVHLYLGESVPIIPFINFTYIHNPGAAFNFLADKGGWQRWALSAIAVSTTVVLLILMYRLDKRAKLFNIAYAIIIGGAFGNLFDRIMRGVVIDFIDFHIRDWHWLTFNMADISIFTGTILIALNFFCYPRRKTIKQKE